MGWEAYPAKLMFPKFAQDWDRLNAKIYDSPSFFDSRLIGPSIALLTRGKEMLCIYRTDGCISGATILQAQGRGLWSVFQASQTQPPAALIADAGLLDALFKILPGFAWTIELQAIDPRYSPDFSHIKLAHIVLSQSPEQTACPGSGGIRSILLFRSDFFATAFAVLKAIAHGACTADAPAGGSDAASADVRCFASTSMFATEGYDLRDYTVRNSIEVSIDWFRLLQRVIYPIDPGVRYYFIAKDDSPSIILPLRLTTKGRIRTIESLSNYYTPLYTPLLSKNSDLFAIRHLLIAATREHLGAHVMRFAPMDPNSRAYQTLLNELRAIGWIPYSFFNFGNWFLKVDGNWDRYLKKRSVNLRSSIKRRSRRFLAEGGSLEIVTSAAGLEQAIAEFEEIYSASWKIPEPYPDFVPSLIRLLSAKGMLRLGIARLHDKPIAAQLWMVGQGKASIYKVAYHESFSSFSPGTVLTSHLMHHVIEHDHVDEVDFLIGDDQYKRIWMSHRRERWGIVAYNPRTIIGFALFLKEAAWRLVKSIGREFKAIFHTTESPRHMNKKNNH